VIVMHPNAWKKNSRKYGCRILDRAIRGYWAYVYYERDSYRREGREAVSGDTSPWWGWGGWSAQTWR
jgi:hypothetical protein